MKRRMFVFATLAAAALLGATSAVVYGTGYVTGPYPPAQTNSLTITVNVPVIVGIYLERNASIDLGLAPNIGHFPPVFPLTWPGYYEDNTRQISFGSTTNLSAYTNNTSGFTLTVQADAANYYGGLPVSQSFYCDLSVNPGEPRTTDGAAPGGNWAAFSSAVGTGVATSGGPTSGWEPHNQIFELQMLGNEPAGSGVRTMTYTIVGNP